MSENRRFHRLERLSPEWKAETAKLRKFQFAGIGLLLVLMVTLGVLAQNANESVVLALFWIIIFATICFVLVGLVWTFRLYFSGRRMTRD